MRMSCVDEACGQLCSSFSVHASPQMRCRSHTLPSDDKSLGGPRATFATACRGSAAENSKALINAINLSCFHTASNGHQWRQWASQVNIRTNGSDLPAAGIL
ncbi:hypothetical protein Atu8062 (plasmid) [Agrobacterium fabrum str. C58]|uniref:Uncharacterized protein n=4 Tax=Rhizobium/Agrobacterium group TaxID=227290 RepID=A8WFG8_AGRFC|nr:hypothetical protein Atu8062 [Agrobacterium fabrum str. C58]ASK43216.1 hypothetical protein [Agrobacterium fabrum]ASK43430.1 hypothetical protein [Agrobacterium radiobacter]ASK43915.1 hypothetical protein [Rhizobium rhizogenes]ASK44390.1 hypothetical protein [Agrobacterium tumefaciens]